MLFLRWSTLGSTLFPYTTLFRSSRRALDMPTASGAATGSPCASTEAVSVRTRRAEVRAWRMAIFMRGVYGYRWSEITMTEGTEDRQREGTKDTADGGHGTRSTRRHGATRRRGPVSAPASGRPEAVGETRYTLAGLDFVLLVCAGFHPPPRARERARHRTALRVSRVISFF